MPIIPNINNQSIALLSDIEQWKEDIADAINTKGGNSTPDESFQQLAEDIQMLPDSGISAEGIVQTEPFSFLKYLTSDINNDITEINDSEITTIVRSYAFYKNIALNKVVMSRLTSISGSNTFSQCSSLLSIDFSNLQTISGSNTFSYCSSLLSVNFLNLIAISGHSTFSNCTLLRSVQLGTLIQCTNLFYNGKPNLRNITIGQNTNIDLPFHLWTAGSVIAEGQSGIDELNANLYDNLLTKLYDHSEDGETRILQIGWLDYITPENIAYANAKGWTITN